MGVLTAFPYQHKKKYISTAMTIAAGIRCKDGLVLCADSEITAGTSKYSSMKIWKESEGLIVTGSGSLDYMKMAFDKLSAASKVRLPSDPDKARATVETLMFSIGEDHILPLLKVKHPYSDDLNFELIVGIRCLDGNLALIKGTLLATKLVEDFECTGTGSEIYRYWTRYLLPSNLDMELAGYFSLFLIREAKKASTGAGEDIHIFKLAAEPSRIIPSHAPVDERNIMAGFPSAATQLIRACASTELLDSDFEKLLASQTENLRALRKFLITNIERSRTRVIPYTSTAAGTPKDFPNDD